MKLNQSQRKVLERIKLTEFIKMPFTSIEEMKVLMAKRYTPTINKMKTLGILYENNGKVEIKS